MVFLPDNTERPQRPLFLAAIEAIGHSLASSLDLNELLDTIVGKALEVMGAESALVVAWDGTAPAYTVLRAGGRLSGDYVAAGTIPAGGGPIARAVRERRPVATRNILTDPGGRLSPQGRGQIEAQRDTARAP